MKRWIRSMAVVVCLVGVGVAPLATAHAALTATLNLKGQKQGTIRGNTKVKGHESDIKVIAIRHEITSPRDAASGLATGKRQHKPFVITKELDKSSPLLNAVLTNNENISQWELAVYLPNAKGVDSLAYTVKLTNASIASIVMSTDADGNVREEVAFTYEKIEWKWLDGAIVAQDDWPKK